MLPPVRIEWNKSRYSHWFRREIFFANTDLFFMKFIFSHLRIIWWSYDTKEDYILKYVIPIEIIFSIIFKCKIIVMMIYCNVMYVCVKHTFMFKHLRSNVHLHDIIFFFLKTDGKYWWCTTPQITNDKTNTKAYIYIGRHIETG